MGMTLSEKIIAAHCGLAETHAGQMVMAKVDMTFANELGAGLAIYEREHLLRHGVFDKSRVAIIPDHFTPNKDVRSAELCKEVRLFARKQGLDHYFEVGRGGIEHVILHEKGLVGSGEIVVGTDSHTCTYGALGALGVGVGSTDFLSAMLLGEIWLTVPRTIRVVFSGTMPRWLTAKDLILHTLGRLGVDGANYQVLEFCGETVSSLSMDARFTLCNMAVEAGAKSAIIAPDETTRRYLEGRAVRPCVYETSDPDAVYSEVIEVDVREMELQVACPHSPANVKPLSALPKAGLPVDQSFVGACTNGRLEDLRVAARILEGKKVHPSVRMIIVPGSQEVFAQAAEEGLFKIFVDAGAAVCTPTCGPCIGGHMGLIAAGERCIATSNRNFKGRMGHMESEVYLSGVPVAAASAVCGYIASPEEVV